MRYACPRCGAAVLLVVSALPNVRVQKVYCVFCMQRVDPVRESAPGKGIDSFLNPLGQ